MSRLYVYGLTRGTIVDAFAAKPVSAPTEAVSARWFGDVTAIVSPIEADEVLPVRRNMMAHTKVLEEAIENHTVLPMQFGLIAEDEAALASLIEGARAPIHQSLDDLDGHVEAGVKLVWNEQAMFDEVAADHPALQATSSQLTRKGEAETYYERIELGRKVDAAINDKRAQEADIFHALIEPLAARMAMRDRDTDTTVTNIAALVRREGLADFEAALERFSNENEGRLTVKLVAPAPAYNFTSLKLDLGGSGSSRMVA